MLVDSASRFGTCRRGLRLNTMCRSSFTIVAFTSIISAQLILGGATQPNRVPPLFVTRRVIGTNSNIANSSSCPQFPYSSGESSLSSGSGSTSGSGNCDREIRCQRLTATYGDICNLLRVQPECIKPTAVTQLLDDICSELRNMCFDFSGSSSGFISGSSGDISGSVSGSASGDISGSVSGSASGDISGSVSTSGSGSSGDISGSVSGSASGDISGSASTSGSGSSGDISGSASTSGGGSNGDISGSASTSGGGSSGDISGSVSGSASGDFSGSAASTSGSGDISGSVSGSGPSGDISGSVSGSASGDISGSVSGSGPSGDISGSVSGSASGDISGSVSGSGPSGDISGSVSGSASGDISGSVSGSASGDISGSVSGSGSSGDISGSVSGSASGDISGSVSGGASGDISGSASTSGSGSSGDISGSASTSGSSSSGGISGSMSGSASGDISGSAFTSGSGDISGSASTSGGGSSGDISGSVSGSASGDISASSSGSSLFRDVVKRSVDSTNGEASSDRCSDVTYLLCQLCDPFFEELIDCSFSLEPERCIICSNIEPVCSGSGSGSVFGSGDSTRQCDFVIQRYGPLCQPLYVYQDLFECNIPAETVEFCSSVADCFNVLGNNTLNCSSLNAQYDPLCFAALQDQTCEFTYSPGVCNRCNLISTLCSPLEGQLNTFCAVENNCYDTLASCFNKSRTDVECIYCAYFADNCPQEEELCENSPLVEECNSILNTGYPCECFFTTVQCNFCRTVNSTCSLPATTAETTVETTTQFTSPVTTEMPPVTVNVDDLSDEEKENSITTEFSGLKEEDFTADGANAFRDSVADIVNKINGDNRRKRQSNGVLVTAADVIIVAPSPFTSREGNLVIVYFVVQSDGTPVDGEQLSSAVENNGEQLANSVGDALNIMVSFVGVSQGLPDLFQQTPPPPTDGARGLSPGAIVGIVIAILVVLCLLVIVIITVLLYFGSTRRKYELGTAYGNDYVTNAETFSNPVFTDIKGRQTTPTVGLDVSYVAANVGTTESEVEDAETTKDETSTKQVSAEEDKNTHL